MAATFKASHSKRWVHTLISTSCTCVFPLDHNNFMIMIMIMIYDHYVANGNQAL